MKAQIVLGGEIDVLSKSEFDEGMKRFDSLLRPNPKDRSIRRIEPASGQMPAAGPLVLDFGGPPAGAMWVPIWVTVTGADDRTSVANSQWALYFGGEAPSVASQPPSLANLLIPAGTAPQIPGFQQIGGKDAVYGHFGDHLYLMVYGPVAGTPIIATARIREVHPASFEELNLL